MIGAAAVVVGEMSANGAEQRSFPYSITIKIPFPTHRLAAIALRALSVDQELSPFVCRSFSLSCKQPTSESLKTLSQPIRRPQNGNIVLDKASEMRVSALTGGALHLGPDHAEFLQNQEALHSQDGLQTNATGEGEVGASTGAEALSVDDEEETVLVTQYTATTNRMLRVSVNGFFESISVVINCMKELDVDVISDEWVGEGEKEVDDLTKVQGLQEVGVINH